MEHWQNAKPHGKKKPRKRGTRYAPPPRAEFGKSWPDHVGQKTAVISTARIARYCTALATPAT
jgi:hypothetical protein